MYALVVRIVSSVLAVSNVVDEEVEEAINADHVSDIEVTEQGNGQQKGVKSEFSVFDQIFNAKRNQGQPHHGVDPHGVVLLNDAVAGECIANGENDDSDRTAGGGVSVHVITKRTAANCSFQQEENQQTLQHAVGGEQAQDKGEGTCQIVGVNSHKFTAIARAKE